MEKINNELKERLVTLRDALRDKLNIEEEMRRTYELTNIWFDDCSVDVRTENYSVRYSRWSHDDMKCKTSPKEPSFTCSASKDIPDTVEEFIEIKKKMDDEKEKCKQVGHKIALFWLDKYFNKDEENESQ